jgi:serine/threonine protein kinase
MVSKGSAGDFWAKEENGCTYSLDKVRGEFVAVKEINLERDADSEADFEFLRSEIGTLCACEHPNIIRYRLSVLPTASLLWIVMDWCEGGSLRGIIDRWGPLPEPVVLEAAESILLALEYLHRQGIGHRDLKGANVLVDGRGLVKLGDFGVAARSSEATTGLVVGSPYWMAPEVIQSAGPEAHVFDACKADIWAFGITLIELLKGRPPLAYLSPVAALQTIPTTTPPRLESTDTAASKHTRALIHACLHDDPVRRPTAGALLKMLGKHFGIMGSSHSSGIGSVPARLPAFLASKTRAASRSVRSDTGKDAQGSARPEDRQEEAQTPLSPRAAEAFDTIVSQWDFGSTIITTSASGDSSDLHDPDHEEEHESLGEDSGIITRDYAVMAGDSSSAIEHGSLAKDMHTLNQARDTYAHVHTHPRARPASQAPPQTTRRSLTERGKPPGSGPFPTPDLLRDALDRCRGLHLPIPKPE